MAFSLQWKSILLSPIAGVNVNSLHTFGKGEEAKGLGCLQIACYCTSLNYSLWLHEALIAHLVAIAWAYCCRHEAIGGSVLLTEYPEWWFIMNISGNNTCSFSKACLFLLPHLGGAHCPELRHCLYCYLAFAQLLYFHMGWQFFLDFSILMTSNHLEVWCAQKYLKARPFGKK